MSESRMTWQEVQDEIDAEEAVNLIKNIVLTFWDGDGDISVKRQIRIGENGARKIIKELQSSNLLVKQDSVQVSKNALDVLLIAAEWAEERMPIRENPLALALINYHGALSMHN